MPRRTFDAPDKPSPCGTKAGSRASGSFPGMNRIEPALLAATVGLLAWIGQDASPTEKRLKRLSMAFGMYALDFDDTYPPMSSPNNANPRMRWADRVYPYVKSVEDFIDPSAPKEMLTRPFNPPIAGQTEALWGGFGYNYQYLGNSRTGAGLPFGRKTSDLSAPEKTVLLSQTQGVRNDAGEVTGGVYTVDPPLPSKRGSGNAAGYYGQGEACGTGPVGCRSTPAEWKPGLVHLVTIEGKVLRMSRARLDDSDGDRMPDNGWYTGSGKPE